MTTDQASIVADIEKVHEIPALYVKACFEWGFTVTVPSGFDQGLIENGLLNVVPALASYPSMHEAVVVVNRQDGSTSPLDDNHDLTLPSHIHFFGGSFQHGVLGSMMTAGLADMIASDRRLVLIMFDMFPR